MILPEFDSIIQAFAETSANKSTVVIFEDKMTLNSLFIPLIMMHFSPGAINAFPRVPPDGISCIRHSITVFPPHPKFLG